MCATAAAVMAVPLADTDYIKRMVGDTLAKGCAATMAAQPQDPVEYLGQWLLQCVTLLHLLPCVFHLNHNPSECCVFRQANVKDIQDQLRQEQEAAAKAEELQQVTQAPFCVRFQIAWSCFISSSRYWCLAGRRSSCSRDTKAAAD